MEDNRLKQRLVGAIVLVSLAVIFIPMLLSGRGEFESIVMSSNIPDKPDSMRTEVVPLDEPPPRPEVPADDAVPVDEHTPEPAPDEGAANDSDLPPPRLQAKKPAAKEAPAPEEVPAEEGEPSTAAGDAAAFDEAADLRTYVVQLASFAEQANATALRDRVRDKGYAAYVERADTGQGPIYRVRVGPEPERSRAEALRKELHEAVGLRGLVVTRGPE